jgi:hypothetical protein
MISMGSEYCYYRGIPARQKQLVVFKIDLVWTGWEHADAGDF